MHWVKRCNKLKRPLLRKYWKPTQEHQYFGKVDELKVAFKPRNAQHKTNRRSQKLTDEDILRIVTQLENENKQASYIAKSIVLREQLKYAQLCLEFNFINKEKFQKINDLFNVSTQHRKDVQKNYKKEIPVPQSPSVSRMEKREARKKQVES